jgi:hypothetical protein
MLAALGWVCQRIDTIAQWVQAFGIGWESRVQGILLLPLLAETASRRMQKLNERHALKQHIESRWVM